MVTDALLNIILGFINTILSPLGAINYNFDIDNIAFILQFIRMAMYLIPFPALMPIFSLFMTLMAFRVAVSLIKTIWDLLPLL